MLVLNAGVSDPGVFANLEDECLQRQVNVNTLHPVYTIKALIDQIMQRDKKTAVVVVSSCAALAPTAGFVLYAATKSLQVSLPEA